MIIECCRIWLVSCYSNSPISPCSGGCRPKFFWACRRSWQAKSMKKSLTDSYITLLKHILCFRRIRKCHRANPDFSVYQTVYPIAPDEHLNKFIRLTITFFLDLFELSTTDISSLSQAARKHRRGHGGKGNEQVGLCHPVHIVDKSAVLVH